MNETRELKKELNERLEKLRASLYGVKGSLWWVAQTVDARYSIFDEQAKKTARALARRFADVVDTLEDLERKINAKKQ